MMWFFVNIIKWFNIIRSKKTEPLKPIETSIEPPEIEEPKHPKSKYLWILDNGHGKLTKGKRSPVFPDSGQLFEYEFNRDIVQRITKGLDSYGIRYKVLVPEVEIGNALKERVRRANAIIENNKNCILVSVHANAGQGVLEGGWSNAEGIETWYYKTSEAGKHVASIFQKHLINRTDWTDRGIKTGRGFYILKYSDMAAILTENGFFNNKNEGQLLRLSVIRQSIAEGHIDAILEIEEKGLEN